MTEARLRFGVFTGPYHHHERNPTLALRRDLDFVQLLDELGFDEVFIGEHHSGGIELVSCPELFLAAAGERTERIRLGTGVVSIPYHHPLHVADRIVLLDHLTRGRSLLGVGPGALPTDAHMLGIQVDDQRRRLEEGFEAVMRLLHDDEPVTMITDWFELREATLNLAPVTGRIEGVVAATRSPSGPRLAGRFGCGLLSLAATDAGGGFDFLRDSWAIAEDKAKDHGQRVDRQQWRLVAPMHIAETEKAAREQVRFGLANQMRVAATGPFGATAKVDVEDVLRTTSIDELIDQRNASGYMVIGTPEMARHQIDRLWKQSGGFGSMLIMVTDMADYWSTRRSMELFAEEVMPHFQGSLVRPTRGWDKLYSNRKTVSGEFRHAQDLAIEQHRAEQEQRRIADDGRHH